MLVKPWSSSRRQFLAVSSMCSSGGMTPSSAGAPMPVKEGWQWPSTMPGISVMPVPSMTVAPSSASRSPPRTTLVIRSATISTSAGKASALSPSKTAAFWMTVRPMTHSLTALCAHSSRWRPIAKGLAGCCRVCSAIGDGRPRRSACGGDESPRSPRNTGQLRQAVSSGCHPERRVRSSNSRVRSSIWWVRSSFPGFVRRLQGAFFALYAT